MNRSLLLIAVLTGLGTTFFSAAPAGAQDIAQPADKAPIDITPLPPSVPPDDLTSTPPWEIEQEGPAPAPPVAMAPAPQAPPAPDPLEACRQGAAADRDVAACIEDGLAKTRAALAAAYDKALREARAGVNWQEGSRKAQALSARAMDFETKRDIECGKAAEQAKPEDAGTAGAACEIRMTAAETAEMAR